MVSAAVSALGGVDVLVNNAGIYTHQDIASTPYAQWQAAWRQVLDVNVHGTANVTWCVVDHLLHRPEGPGGARIITVGSRGAYRGEPTAPAYGASKAAVHSMTQSLAIALAPHDIAVAAVAPGFTRTDMAESVLASAGRRGHQGAEPLWPGGRAGGGRVGGGLARIPPGAVGQRGRPRSQRRVLPALSVRGRATCRG